MAVGPLSKSVGILFLLFAMLRGYSLDAFRDSEENKGVHTGPYHACVADISRELKSVAYAQQESFENVQVQQFVALTASKTECKTT